MANEITLSAKLELNKSGVILSGQVSNLHITQTGTNNIANIQNIGTSTEQLSFGDVTTPGYLLVKNLDATNFVLVSLATPAISGTSFCKLLPGECCLVPTRQTTVYAIADTAACDVLVCVFEL